MSFRDDAAPMLMGTKSHLLGYFGSVRELEQRLHKAKEWAKKPKPKVDATQPQGIPNPADWIGRTRLLFDLTHLALQTDSTRLMTIMRSSPSLVPPIPGETMTHHDLAHHGQDPTKLARLKIVEIEKIKQLRDLLAKLKQTKESGSTLLDRTIVFFGSNLGNVSNHSGVNLPVLVAGGGFKTWAASRFGSKESPHRSPTFTSICCSDLALKVTSSARARAPLHVSNNAGGLMLER